MRRYLNTDIKLLNRRAVYEYVRESADQTVSRPEISKNLLLTDPTVLKITGFFLERKILTGLGEANVATVGRKPNLLAFNPDAAYCIGAAYDGNCLSIAAVNLNYESIAFRSRNVQAPLSTIMERYIPEAVSSLALDESGRIGVGFALAAAVDTENNCILMCNPSIDLQGKSDFSPEVDALSKRMNVPVILENDVNAAAISEFQMRRSSSKDDFVYIMLGIGFGSGLVLDGKLRRGKNYAAGEVGYMSLDHAYRVQPYGVGQLESLLCRPYLLERFGFDVLEDSAESRDVRDIVEHVARHVALCIANISATLDVDHFIIGGYIAEKLGEKLIHQIRAYCIDSCLYPKYIFLSTRPDSVPCGAGAIACDAVLDHFLSDEFLTLR